MSEVESYIIKFPHAIQTRLFAVRSIGFDIFLDAKERIYHRVPTFSTGGRDVINYAAYEDHITLWVGYEMVDFLENAYPEYKYTKVTIQFPHDEDFPVELVREICEMVESF